MSQIPDRASSGGLTARYLLSVCFLAASLLAVSSVLVCRLNDRAAKRHRNAVVQQIQLLEPAMVHVDNLHHAVSNNQAVLRELDRRSSCRLAMHQLLDEIGRTVPVEMQLSEMSYLLIPQVDTSGTTVRIDPHSTVRLRLGGKVNAEFPEKVIVPCVRSMKASTVLQPTFSEVHLTSLDNDISTNRQDGVGFMIQADGVLVESSRLNSAGVQQPLAP